MRCIDWVMKQTFTRRLIYTMACFFPLNFAWILSALPWIHLVRGTINTTFNIHIYMSYTYIFFNWLCMRSLHSHPWKSQVKISEVRWVPFRKILIYSLPSLPARKGTITTSTLIDNTLYSSRNNHQILNTRQSLHNICYKKTKKEKVP